MALLGLLDGTLNNAGCFDPELGNVTSLFDPEVMDSSGGRGVLAAATGSSVGAVKVAGAGANTLSAATGSAAGEHAR